VFRPAYESGFTAKFGYDDRKGVGSVIVDPLGRGDGRAVSLYALHGPVSRAAGKAEKRKSGKAV